MNEAPSFPMTNSFATARTPKASGQVMVYLDRLLVMLARHLRTLVISAAIGLIVALAWIYFSPPSYTSVTEILIDENLTKFGSDAADVPAFIQADSMVLNQIQILQSTRLARQVMLAEKLDTDPDFLNPPPSVMQRLLQPVGIVMRLVMSPFASKDRPAADAPAAQSAAPSEVPVDGSAASVVAEPVRSTRFQQSVMQALRANLLIGRSDRSYVLVLGYKSHDPVLAYRITKAYAKAYLEDQLGANYDASKQSGEWLQARLAELAASQRRASLAVEQFRKEKNLASTKDGLVSDQRLTGLNREYVLAQIETAKAKARSERLQSIVEGGIDSAVQNASIATSEGGGQQLNLLREQFVSVNRRERDVAAQFGPQHPQAIALRQERQGLERQIFNEMQNLAQTYANELSVARAREASLLQGLQSESGISATANQDQVQLRALEQRADALSALYTTFLARFETTSQQQSFPIGKMRVISEADVPTSPSGPRSLVILVFFVFFGLFVGTCSILWRELNERYFRVGEQIDRELKMKFVGYLPFLSRSDLASIRRGKGDASTLAMSKVPEAESFMHFARLMPDSPFAETLRGAKLAIDLLPKGAGARVVGTASILPGEGKSTVAGNLAEMLASNGARTLLVDADLRNPEVSRRLVPGVHAGLVEVLKGQPWQNVLQPDGASTLAILPTVPIENGGLSSQFLSSDAMRRLIEEAKRHFDYIIVDLPPLGATVDAKAVEPLLDTVLLIAEWGKTPRGLLKSFFGTDDTFADKIAGVLLNKTRMRELPKYAAWGSAERYFGAYGLQR